MSLDTVIDQKTYDELVATVGEDFIGELVATYLEETPQLLVQLREAWNRRDVESFRRSAHSIKSSSASLGALIFSEKARGLEMLGKQGSLEGAETALAQLEADYTQVAQIFTERMA